MDRIREALGSGLPVIEVHAELAAGTDDVRAAALVVCDALGIPRGEAERRLRGCQDLWGEFGPGDERLVGELLDGIGLFDVHVTLDERGERIRGLMRRAMGASGGISSGIGVGILRKLDTGRLPEAFAVLVRVRVRERGDPVRYWAVLGTAGELLAAWLPSGDEEAAGRVREARERCAREAALTAR
ncbi:hypothetical protein PV721_03775 [Streptomyces sp. MB09-01]|uniref:hypothetical protein n=1 Tax=Streptomyces sp. MB09-01 TaxID=3028666 RepID=UPI0029A00D05|nr:hypothetical protein [Streptomyces sp. MB09-01]MDX3533502.1 hypothetical protein [Streptomyces sp. MB09-01]